MMRRALDAKKTRALQLLRLQLRRGCSLLELPTTSFVKKTLKAIQAEPCKLEELDAIVFKHVIQENKYKGENNTSNHQGIVHKDHQDISFECSIIRELLLMCLAEQLTVSFYERQFERTQQDYEQMISKRLRLQELLLVNDRGDMSKNEKEKNQDEGIISNKLSAGDKEKYQEKKCRQRVQIEVLKSLFRTATEVLRHVEGGGGIQVLQEEKLNIAIKKEIQSLEDIKLYATAAQTNAASKKQLFLQVTLGQLLLSTACFVIFKRSESLGIACNLAKQCKEDVVKNGLKEECGICAYVMLKEPVMNQEKLRNIEEFVEHNERLFLAADKERITSKIGKIKRGLMEKKEKLGNQLKYSIEDEAKRYLQASASGANVLEESCQQSYVVDVSESFQERSRCLGGKEKQNEEQEELSKLLEDHQRQSRDNVNSNDNREQSGFEIISLEDLDGASTGHHLPHRSPQLASNNNNSNNTKHLRCFPQNLPRCGSTNQIQRLSHSNSIENNGFMTLSSSRSILSSVIINHNNQSSGNNTSRIILHRQASSQSTLPSSSLSNSTYSGSVGLLQHHHNGKQKNKEQPQTLNKILVFEDFKLGEALTSHSGGECSQQQKTPVGLTTAGITSIPQDQQQYQATINNPQQSLDDDGNEQNEQSQYVSLIEQLNQVVRDKNNDKNTNKNRNNNNPNPIQMHTKAAQSQPCLVSQMKMIYQPRAIFKNIHGDTSWKKQKGSEDVTQQLQKEAGEVSARGIVQGQNISCTPRSAHSIKEKRKLLVLSGQQQTKENNNNNPNYGCFSQRSSASSSKSGFSKLGITPRLEQSHTGGSTISAAGAAPVVSQQNQIVWQEVMALKATEEIEQKCLMLRRKQFSVKSLGNTYFSNGIFKKDIVQQNSTGHKINMEKANKDTIEIWSQRNNDCRMREDQQRKRNMENEFNGFVELNWSNRNSNHSSRSVHQENRQEQQQQPNRKKQLIVLQQVGQCSTDSNSDTVYEKDLVKPTHKVDNRHQPQVLVGRIPLQEFSENSQQFARRNKQSVGNISKTDEERLSWENNQDNNGDQVISDNNEGMQVTNTEMIYPITVNSMRSVSNPRKLSQFAMESQPSQPSSQCTSQEEQSIPTFQERQPFKRASRNKSSLVEQMQEQLNIQDKELLKKTILHNIRSTYIHNTSSQLSTNSIPHSYMKRMSFPLIPEETEKSIQCFSTPKQSHTEEKKGSYTTNPKSGVQMSQFQRASIRMKRDSVDSNTSGVMKNQEIARNYTNQYQQELQSSHLNTNSNRVENNKTHPSPSNDTPRNASAVGDMSNLAVGTTIVSWEGFSPDRASMNQCKGINFKAAGGTAGGIVVTPVKNAQRMVSAVRQSENSNTKTPKREQQQKGSCIRSNNRCQQSPSARKNNNYNSSQLRQSKDKQRGLISVNSVAIPEFVSSSIKNSGKLRRLKSFSDIRQFTLTTPNNTQQTPGQQQHQQQPLKYSAARQLFSIKRQSSLRLSPSKHPVDIEQLITPFNILDEEDFEEPFVASSRKCNNNAFVDSMEMQKKQVQVSQMALLACMQPVKFTLKGRQAGSTTLSQYPMDYGTCSVHLLTKHHTLAITLHFTHKGTLKYNIHYDPLTLLQDSLSPVHASNQTAWPLVLEYFERDLLKKHGLEISTDPSILANAYATSRELSIDDQHWMQFYRQDNTTPSNILPSADAQGVVGMQNVSQELYGLLSMKKHHLFANQLEIPKITQPARFLVNQDLTARCTIRFVQRFKEGYFGVVLADMVFNQKKNLITVRGAVYKTTSRIAESVIGNSYVIGQFEEKQKLFQEAETRKLDKCKIRRSTRLAVMDLAQKVLFPTTDRSVPIGFGSVPVCDSNNLWSVREGANDEFEVEEEQVHRRTSFAHRNIMDQYINPLNQYNLLLRTKHTHDSAQQSGEKGLFDSNFEQTIQLLDEGTSFFNRTDHPLPNSPTHSPLVENFRGIEVFNNNNANPTSDSTGRNSIINLYKNRRSERRGGEINMSCLGQRVFRIEYYGKSGMLERLKGIFQAQYDQQQSRFVQTVEYRIMSCSNHLRFYNASCILFSLTQKQLFDTAFNYSAENKRKSIEIRDISYGNNGKVCQNDLKGFPYSKQLKIVLHTMKSTLVHSAQNSYHYSNHMHTLTMQSLQQPGILRTLLLTNSPQLNRFAFQNQVMFLYRNKALGKIAVNVNWFEFSQDIAMRISVQTLQTRSKIDSLVLTKLDIEQLLNHPISIILEHNSHVSSVKIMKITKSLLDLGVYVFGDLLGRKLTLSGKSNKSIPHGPSHAYHKQSNSKKTSLPALLNYHEQPIKTLSHQVLQLQKGFCVVSLQYNIVLDVYIVNAYFPSSARKLSTVVTLEHLDEPSFVQGILRFIGEEHHASEHEDQMKDFNQDNQFSQVAQVQEKHQRAAASSQQFKSASPSSPQPSRFSGIAQDSIKWTMREVQRRISPELRTVERYLRTINTPGIENSLKQQSTLERQRISRIWKEEVMQGMVVVQQPTHTYLEVFNKISLPMHESLYSCIVAPKKQSAQTQGHYLEFFVQSQKNTFMENNFFDDFPYLSFATSDDLNIIIRCTGLQLSSDNYPDATAGYAELDNMTSDDSPLFDQYQHKGNQRLVISPKQHTSSSQQRPFIIRSFNLRSLLNLQVAEGFFKHQGDYTHSRLFLSDLKSLCEFLALKIQSNDFPEICSELQTISTAQKTTPTQRMQEKQSFLKNREEQIRRLVFMLPDNLSQLKEEEQENTMLMSESNYGSKMALSTRSMAAAREQLENGNYQAKNDSNTLTFQEDHSFTSIIQVKPYVVVAALTLAPIERQVRVILYLPSSGRSFSSYVYFDEIQEIIPFFEGKLQRVCLKDICRLVLKSQQASMLDGLEEKIVTERNKNMLEL